MKNLDKLDYFNTRIREITKQEYIVWEDETQIQYHIKRDDGLHTEFIILKDEDGTYYIQHTDFLLKFTSFYEYLLFRRDYKKYDERR